MIIKRKHLIIIIVIIICITKVPGLIVGATTNSEEEDSEEEVQDTAATVSVGEEFVSSEAAIVMDFDTGLIIYEYNADILRVPASMAKMAAVYVIFDAIRDGLVSYETRVEISESLSLFSYNRGFSNVPMPEESSYTVRELLDVVIVRSASAATVALAEAIFGSEEVLVAKMNEKAVQLDIEATFFDSWGRSPHNRISAHGMAELTRALIKEYPEVLDITSKREVYFDERSYRSTNLLLGEYDGINGFKTGFTNPAGWCFTGTAQQDGRRIISVTMGSVYGYRFPDSTILLNYGFENYSTVIASHFRNEIHKENFPQFNNTTLVPISMYNIYATRYLEMRNLAIALNEG